MPTKEVFAPIAALRLSSIRSGNSTRAQDVTGCPLSGAAVGLPALHLDKPPPTFPIKSRIIKVTMNPE